MRKLILDVGGHPVERPEPLLNSRSHRSVITSVCIVGEIACSRLMGGAQLAMPLLPKATVTFDQARELLSNTEPIQLHAPLRVALG